MCVSATQPRAVEWLQGVLEKRYAAVRATGVNTETNGGGRGVALRIECHRCQVIRTGRLDASVTAAWLPVACLALHDRAQHAVVGALFGALRTPAAAAAGDVLTLSPAQRSQPG